MENAQFITGLVIELHHLRAIMTFEYVCFWLPVNQCICTSFFFNVFQTLFEKKYLYPHSNIVLKVFLTKLTLSNFYDQKCLI